MAARSYIAAMAGRLVSRARRRWPQYREFAVIHLPRNIRCLGLITLLGMAGCATTRHEPPPEVAPQPPEAMASEMVEEGRAMQALDAAASGSRRIRPTGRSIAEIRDQSSNAAHPLDFHQRLDALHDRIYVWGQQAVQATDNRFADKDKPLRPVPAAPFRLSTTIQTIDHSDGLHLDLDMEFDITLRLPNIEERLGLFITSDELDSGPRAAGQDSLLRAGLRYRLLRDLDFDVGVRVDAPPVLFTSVKWMREFQLGSWDFYPMVKLFAETRESVGTAGGLTFDRWMGRNLLRSSTYAKWRHDKDRTEWSQTMIYARARELIVPDRYGSYPRADDIGRGWGVRLQASGEHTREVSRYEAGVFYRRRTRASWLYWHVEPLVRWDRDYHWDADPGFRIGIDALFWDLVRPAR